MNQIYLDTARLLIQVAPLVFADDTFALKGGTAINLFMRDMPRLSVDLDLVFPDYTLPRERALERIDDAMRQAAARLERRGFQVHAPAKVGGVTKLLVRRDRIVVKVEATPINPSDLGLLTGPADLSKATSTGSGDDVKVTAPVLRASTR